MSEQKSKLYQDVIYGPYETLHFGKALGINILGNSDKLCSFNCPYCYLGSTTLRLNQIKKADLYYEASFIADKISEAFQEIHKNGPGIDAMVVSGNGEPTLHPDFGTIVQQMIESRNQWMPGKPIIILSNGARLDCRKTADILNLVDERVIKIDAGNNSKFLEMNAPLSRSNLSRILVGAKYLKDYIVQTMFVEGTVDNTSGDAIDDWIELIAVLKPKQVLIQGMSRPGAIHGLVRCSEDKLFAIASRLERKTGLRALVTP